MQHSTSILDINDDGERERRRNARGKENIPPAPEEQTVEQVYTGPVTRSRANASKSVTMSDRSRVALAELNPSDFATEEQLQSDSEHASSDEEGHDDDDDDNDEQNEVDNTLASIPEERDEAESLEPKIESKSRPLTRRLTRAAAAAAVAELQHQSEETEEKEHKEDAAKPVFNIFDENTAEKTVSN